MAQRAPKKSQSKAKLPSFIAWARKSRLAYFLALWLAAVLVLESFFFSEVLKSFNYLEIFPRELVFPFVMHLATAAFLAALIYFLKTPRSLVGKLVSVTLLALLMANFHGRLLAVAGIFRALIPILPSEGNDLPIISLLFFALLVFIVRRLGKWFERSQQRHEQLSTTNMLSAVFIALSFVFLGQAIKLATIVPAMVRQSSVQATPLEKPANAAAAQEKPDIYYLVFDRYASNQVLQEQLGYDNKRFTDFLRGNDFVVNEKAYSNYPFTTMSISSTMSGSYTNNVVAPFKDARVQSKTLYHNLIRQSPVIKALMADGYSYYHIGSDYGATNKAPLATRDYTPISALEMFGKEQKRLRGIEASQYQQSIFRSFTQMQDVSWWPVRYLEVGKAGGIVDQFNLLEGHAKSPEQGGRFIFVHIILPHEPFVFNSDGSLSIYPDANNIGKEIKQKYLDQLQFLNMRLEEILVEIQKQSQGKAIVILNADEGPYPDVMNSSLHKSLEETEETMAQWSEDWLKMKFGILQAVHIPRASEQDLRHLSSVNVFRIVLNSYLGYNLAYLPECHFVLNRSVNLEFDYSYTQKLGSTSEQCANFDTSP